MALFKKTSTTSSAEKITQFQATTSDYGTGVNYLIGTPKVGSQLIEYTDFEAVERRTTTKSGKSKSTQIDYLYYVKLCLGLGEPSTDIQLGSIWVNNNKYSDLASLNSTGESGSGLTFLNNGGKPYNTTYDLAMLYGRCYLGENTASVPSFQFEVKGILRDTGDGTDANVSDVVKFLLEECGMGDYIDTESWNRYKSFCTNAGLLVSTPADYFTQQKNTYEIIKELLDLSNTYMFWSVDKFKFVPRYPASVGDWTPDTTIRYTLTNDDFGKDSFSFKRTDSSQQFNVVKVNFTNRDNDYETESISFVSVADAQAKGVKQTEINMQWLHNKESAVKFAKMKAEQYLNEVTTYDFTLDWCFNRLEAGDLVRIQHSTLNINEVVRISKIVENANGTIKVTAISTPIEAYGDAEYTVRSDYQYVNFNVSGGSIAEPLFIIPPSDLVVANSGAEVWVALRGTNTNWGGCTVYVSKDDNYYSEAGTQSLESLYGTVLADNTTTISVKLGNITQKELISNQLVWVNGEVISYETATLTAFNTYTLSGLERGLHGTTQTTHINGEDFAILDSSLFCLQLTKNEIGETLYFRFPSFNIFKAMSEDVNLVDAFDVVANLYDLPNVTDIVAYTKYRELQDDITRYDIIVEWNPPSGFENYSKSQVWYKTNNANGINQTIANGQKATEVGYLGKWIYGGSGYDTVTIPQAVIGDTYQIAVCTCDVFGNRETPDQSAHLDPPLTVAMKSEIPNTPANVGTKIDSNSFTVFWDEVRNADIKYYEVRLDTNVGVENSNFLGRTTDIKLSTNAITQRIGKLYIYSVSAYDKTSAPAIIEYQYGKPSAPVLTLDAKIQGIQCKAGSLPVNCYAIHWYFEAGSNIADVVNNNVTYYHSCQPSVYTVYACYVDWFGDGNMSERQMVTVKQYIDPALIEEASIGANKLNASTQQALSNAINSIQPSDLTSWWDGTKGNYYTSSQTDAKIHEGLVTYVDDNVYAYVEEKTSEAVNEVMQTISPEGVLKDYATQNWTSSQINSSVAAINNTTSGLRTDLTSVQQTATSINNIATRLSQLASSETFKEVKKSIHSTLTVGQAVTWSASSTSLEFYIDVLPNEVYSVSLFGGNSESWKVWFTDSNNKVIVRGCKGVNYTGTTGSNGDNNKLVTNSSTTNFTKISDTVTVPKNNSITRMWLFTRCDSNQTLTDVSKWATVQKVTYSAITQLTDGIQLKVNGSKSTSSINLTEGTITLDTSLFTVGGTYKDANGIEHQGLTTISNGAIKTSMLDADCVTADKINVTDLSAITGNFGTFETLSNDKLGKVVITGGLIQVYSRTSTSSSNWIPRVKLGVW